MSSLAFPSPASVHYADTVASLPRLEGRTVAVTGSTSGTGAVFARTAGARGARVIVLNRASPLERTLPSTSSAGPASTWSPSNATCRASSPFAPRRGSWSRPLLTASTYSATTRVSWGLPDRATVDGCDIQMQTNHLSHFLLTSLAWPAICAAADARGESRVVNHSSGARRGPALQRKYLERQGGNLGGDGFPGFAKWRRYQQSKLANLLFTYALSDRMPDQERQRGVKSAGPLTPARRTRGWRARSASAGGNRLLDRMILRRTLRVAHSVEDGALGILRASFDPTANDGDFFGPAGNGAPGPAVLLPAERDVPSQALLGRTSEDTTGVTAYFDAA